jgi:beta-fructofuranosidase
MAPTCAGPWLTPTVDTFDGRAFYAAKSASDGAHTHIFGWNPSREGASDTGGWLWGGNLVVHELAQSANGELKVRFPRELDPVFRAHRRTLLGEGGVRITTVNGHEAISGGILPEVSRLSFQFQFAPGTRAFGVGLRVSEDVESGYYVRVEPGRRRLVFDRWPRPADIPHAGDLERPADLLPDTLYTLSLYVNGTIGVIYLCDSIALSVRMYDHAEGGWGLFVTEGDVRFSDIELCEAL